MDESAQLIVTSTDNKVNNINECKITSHNVEHYNVLYFGTPRSGKTTHIKTLQNPNHDASIDHENYYGMRRPENPKLSTLLFSIDNKFINLNVVDTCGFSEFRSSTGTTVKDYIEDIIIEIVKKGITECSLILITISHISGLTMLDINNITTCLKILGPQTAPNVCFLVTRFEGHSKENEDQWINDFKGDERSRFLRIAAGGGFLFTGALRDYHLENIAYRDENFINQTRRNADFFSKLLDGKPVSLLTPNVIVIRSALMVQKSVIMTCLNLEAQLSELKKNWNNVSLMHTNLINRVKSVRERDPPIAAEVLACVDNAINDINNFVANNNIYNYVKNVEFDINNYQYQIGDEIKNKRDEIIILLNMCDGLRQGVTNATHELEWEL